jgi:hypothetical protein
LNCEQIYELLSARLDGALSAEDEARVQAHLDACPDCRRLYEAMASIEEKTAELAVPAPEGLKRGVMYRIRQESGKQKKKRGYWGAGTGFGLIAAVLVLLVGTGVIRLPRPQTAAKASAGGATVSHSSPSAEKPAQPAEETLAFALPQADGSDSSTGYFFSPGSLIANAVQTPGSTAAPDTDLNSPGEGSSESSGEGLPEVRGTVRPVDEMLRLICADLSRQAEAPILLYTEFSADSLLDLLAEAEPELYDRLVLAEPTTPAEVLGDESTEPDESGLTVFATDYETALAVQEWLLQNLPRSAELDADGQAEEQELLVRMEELDPESGALNRIVTWAPRTAEIDWPEDWPEDWAVRLRTGENWALFYPEEDFIPEAGDLALLIFAAREAESETR